MKFFLLILCVIFLNCEKKEELPFDYSTVEFKGRLPQKIYALQENIPHLKNQIALEYFVQFGDTLKVKIYEFNDDIYALDYYMNSGRFQGIIPIVRGNDLEQSFRSGTRIFVFNHDTYRRYERKDLEVFAKTIEDPANSFPQAFLSFPFENRERGKSSVQTDYFFGKKALFPLLVQSYSEGELKWNIARSFSEVDKIIFENWKRKFQNVKPRNITPKENRFYFVSGENSYGMGMQLSNGRVAIIWGYLDWLDLERKFDEAVAKISQAKF